MYKIIYAIEIVQCKCIYGTSASSNCVNASNYTSDAASVSSEFGNTNFIWMVITLQLLLILTELIEKKYEFNVKDDTFNSVKKEITIYTQWEMTSVLLHKATRFKLIISYSFQSQSTLFWELFKWEKICNWVQIGGIVLM